MIGTAVFGRYVSIEIFKDGPVAAFSLAPHITSPKAWSQSHEGGSQIPCYPDNSTAFEASINAFSISKVLEHACCVFVPLFNNQNKQTQVFPSIIKYCKASKIMYKQQKWSSSNKK